MYQIVFTKQALKDIQQLMIHLNDFFGPQKATKLVDELINSIMILEAFPGLCKQADYISNIVSDYGYLKVKSDFVFLKIDEDAEVIRVVKIFDNRLRLAKEVRMLVMKS